MGEMRHVVGVTLRAVCDSVDEFGKELCCFQEFGAWDCFGCL